MKLSILFQIVFIFVLFFTSCGTKIVEIQNCCPSFILESTKSIKFSLFNVKENKISYSSLVLNEEERFLNVSVPNSIDSYEDEFKIDVEQLPEKSKILFSGNIKKSVPYGLNTAFNSEITYFEGNINERTIWMASFHLISFIEFASESELNKNSLILIKADSSNIGYNCSNKNL